MKLPLMNGIEVNLEDDVDLYFFHEYLSWQNYKFRLENSNGIKNKVDRSEFSKKYAERSNTGGWKFAERDVYSFDSSRWKLPNSCNTMCISNKEENNKTLIIQATSLAGHASRLSIPFASTSDTVYNIKADILVVNEDPLRFPESVYPSLFMLGCSSRLNNLELMGNDIRRIIKENGKEYKNIVLFSDSKLAASGVSLAIELSDIVTHCFIVHGTTTNNFNQSPIVKSYMQNPNINLTTVQWLHIVKAYQYTFRHKISNRILDPMNFISDYNIKVDYYYGKYDSEFLPFLKYAQSIDNGINYHEVDYKSKYETHNIRNHVDRFMLRPYIEDLNNET